MMDGSSGEREEKRKRKKCNNAFGGERPRRRRLEKKKRRRGASLHFPHMAKIGENKKALSLAQCLYGIFFFFSFALSLGKGMSGRRKT